MRHSPPESRRELIEETRFRCNVNSQLLASLSPSGALKEGEAARQYPKDRKSAAVLSAEAGSSCEKKHVASAPAR